MGISTVIETPDTRPEDEKQIDDNPFRAAALETNRKIADKKNLQAKSSAGDMVTLDGGHAVLVPDPPPGLLPEDPVYRSVWKKLVVQARSDPQLALSLVNNAKLREQAEAEQALQAREASAIPSYLREHPPVVAVALERTDSTLAAIVQRGDNGYPMTELESTVYRWILAGRSGNDRMGGATADAIADCLNGMEGARGTAGGQPTSSTFSSETANRLESGDSRGTSLAADDDRTGGGGISGGLPESTASGDGGEEREGGLSSPGTIPEQRVPSPEKSESKEKVGPQKNDPEKTFQQKLKCSKKSSNQKKRGRHKKSEMKNETPVSPETSLAAPSKTHEDAPGSTQQPIYVPQVGQAPKRAKSPLDDLA